MNEKVKQEIEALIEALIVKTRQPLTIEKFANEVDWRNISSMYFLSEDFIREFKDRVSWIHISTHQKLSENFIREFKDRVSWIHISAYQKLSENFIREFKECVNWHDISIFQNLSEDFIREFKDRVNWHHISKTRKLSKEFIDEFGHDFFKSPQFNYFVFKSHQETRFKEKSDEQKLQEVKAYAEKYNLEFDGTYLYAFREHDKHNRGAWNKTICYDEVGKEYRDWHCNMDETDAMSFGLGIWPKLHNCLVNVNTRVKVHYKDWGCEAIYTNGKGRVMAFTLLGPLSS